MLRPESIILLHLANPTEKLWGVLKGLTPEGVTIRGISLSSFDDWMLQAAKDEPPTLGLSTVFVPLFRVERIFLDETVGEVESYSRRFERQVGIPVSAYLGLDEPAPQQPS